MPPCTFCTVTAPPPPCTLCLARLAITVLVVGLGLLASAQEKLQSLDWVSGLIAIVVIGFGADVLKRALSKP